MKVGTDGILLGAWSNTADKRRALDIGTGTGLIALMLAQKARDIQITALEIDQNALSQAQVNIANSPWANQIELIDGDVTEWSQQTDHIFDLIISNPPFFSDALKGPDQQRNLARHNEHLTFEQLLTSAKQVSAIEGVFDVILPMSERDHFLVACDKTGWHEQKLLLVSHNNKKAPIRFLSRLNHSSGSETETSCLAIRDTDGQYSEAYKTLCRDFYLNF